MANPDKDCRTQHCSNHHLGWTIAGTIFIVSIITGAICYFGRTNYNFPNLKEEPARHYTTSSNEINLLESHLIAGPLSK